VLWDQAGAFTLAAGHLAAARVALTPHFRGNQTMPHSGSFSEQIEEISNAFPAVLDCATCRMPQPMKIDLLPSARTGDGNIIVYRCTACGAIRDRKARRAAREGQR
jgi:bacterioferritin-associated ferredoxin